VLLSLLVFFAPPTQNSSLSYAQALKRPDIEIYFSPKGGCTEAVVRELAGAKKQIRIQAYSFTSAPIAQAITQAKARGVDIIAILDKSQETEAYSSATYLANHNIPVLIDKKHAIAHNKIIIIDGQTVLTGSFNFTSSAEERNAENLLVLRNPEVATVYLANFEEHKSHSGLFGEKMNAKTL
jgi:phosphatidylserine/phosphatidylglycerophosphate/cardiolipin synthase-like enzyme